MTTLIEDLEEVTERAEELAAKVTKMIDSDPEWTEKVEAARKAVESCAAYSAIVEKFLEDFRAGEDSNGS